MEKSVSTNIMRTTEDEMWDKISGLPDSLLLHILSFLPAKEAVATSLLSKRWRPFWFSLPTLYLNRQDFKSLAFFHQFVGKMLKSVDLKSVTKFVLRYDYYYYKSHNENLSPQEVSKWINAVIISNKVEHLELHLNLRRVNYDQLPSTVFTANSIKVLKLSGNVTVGTLSHVNLPLLEVLHLRNVNIPDFRSLEMLLSASSLLKDLVLKTLEAKKSYFPLNIGGFYHLVTAEVPQSLRPLRVLSNVTFLRLHSFKSSQSLDIPTFYNLTYLEFEYYSHDWETTSQFLQSCPKLEILVINQLGCIERLEPMMIYVPQCVSSNLKEFHLRNYVGNNGEFDFARFIMKNAIVLGIISISRPSYSRVTWDNIDLKKISSCPISSVNCRLLLK